MNDLLRKAVAYTDDWRTTVNRLEEISPIYPGFIVLANQKMFGQNSFIISTRVHIQRGERWIQVHSVNTHVSSKEEKPHLPDIYKKLTVQMLMAADEIIEHFVIQDDLVDSLGKPIQLYKDVTSLYKEQ